MPESQLQRWHSYLRQSKIWLFKYCLPYYISHLASFAFNMAEDPVTSETRDSSHASASSKTLAHRGLQRNPQVCRSPLVNIITHIISVSALIVQEDQGHFRPFSSRCEDHRTKCGRRRWLLLLSEVREWSSHRVGGPMLRVRRQPTLVRSRGRGTRLKFKRFTSPGSFPPPFTPWLGRLSRINRRGCSPGKDVEQPIFPGLVGFKNNSTTLYKVYFFYFLNIVQAEVRSESF